MIFHFSKDPDGELDGNDASQEHFTGHRLTSVAKEIGQNTNDARSDIARDKGVPAVVSFEKIQVLADKIPDLKGLKEKLEGCLDYAENHLKNDDLSTFYKKALLVVSQVRIPVLRVCDWNTCGLEGPFEGASPVVAFAKGKGISNKASISSGGSRGMGKNAIFTISDLRTSFFSTLSLNKETEKCEYLSQGKAVLISDLNNSEIRKGTGYCGKPGANAINGEQLIPDWLKRSGHIPSDAVDQRGLSLFALGFNQGSDWHLHLAASALTTFFSAIQQGLLEFQIKDGNKKLVINKESYLKFFDKIDVINSLDLDEQRKLSKAKIYAQILEDADAEDPRVFVEHFENPKIGKFRLCIRVKDELPRNIALIRTGMLITESMPNLRRFTGKDFAAVLQARTEKGMAFLRGLEGAEHNALEPDRIDDKKERQKAKRTLNEITRRTRELLDKYIRVEVEDTDDIDELAQFFPYELGDGEQDQEKNELNPLGKLLLMPKKKSKPKMKVRPPIGGEEGGEDGGATGGGSGTDDGGSGGGTGDKPVVKRIPVNISNVRAPLVSDDPSKRLISFSVNDGGSFNLSLFIAGSDEDETIFVKNASVGHAKEGLIQFVDVEPGSRLSSEVELTRSFSGAIKAFAFQVTEQKVSDQ